MTPNTDLDVDTPEKVADTLRQVADKYRASAIELASAWQDKNAGKIWDSLATILDCAAISCEKALSQHGF